MEWWTAIVLAVAVTFILFPAVFVWYLNIGGSYAAIRARKKQAARAKDKTGIEISDPGYSRGPETTPARRAGYAALFFLVAILFPVLIWVALFIAVRKPLFRTVKKAGYAAFFLLLGVSMSALIWVGFFIVVRKPLVAVMRRVAYTSRFLLVSFFMPVLVWVDIAGTIREPLLRGVRWVSLSWQQIAGSKRALRPVAFIPLLLLSAVLSPVLIWVALAVAIHELSLRWRESRLPSTLVCRLDTDCPPGYICITGKCVPQY